MSDFFAWHFLLVMELLLLLLLVLFLSPIFSFRLFFSLFGSMVDGWLVKSHTKSIMKIDKWLFAQSRECESCIVCYGCCLYSICVQYTCFSIGYTHQIIIIIRVSSSRERRSFKAKQKKKRRKNVLCICKIWKIHNTNACVRHHDRFRILKWMINNGPPLSNLS